MSTVNILGCDPGLASFGVAVLQLDLDADPIADVVTTNTLVTEKVQRMRDLRSATDNTRRARLIYRWVSELIDRYRVKAICAEEVSIPRNASSAVKVALSWSAIIGNAESRNLPLVELPPQVIKQRITGRKSASKKQIQSAMEALYGAVPWPIGPRGGEGLINHAADALAAATAGLESDVILALLQAP